MKKLNFLLSLFILFSFNIKGQMVNEDYEIYNIILRDNFNIFDDDDFDESNIELLEKEKFLSDKKINRIVIREITNLHKCDFENLIIDLPKLEISTFNNLLDVNNKSYNLNKTKLRKKHIKIHLIEIIKINELFKDKLGWDRFYKKYSKSQGIMTFSRVGYNEYKTQALVYVGNQEFWRSGVGYYILFEKKNDEWQEIGFALIWIS